MIPWLIAGAIVFVGIVVGVIVVIRVLAMVGESESESESDGDLEAEDDRLDDMDSSWRYPARSTSRHAHAR